MERDLYEILGVQKGASADELKKAHRKLVREFHPDVNKAAGADKKFAQIQEAYDILSDAEKRKLYDQFGMAGVKAGAAGPAGGGGPRGGDPFGGMHGGGQWQDADPSSFEEIFGSMFGGRAGRGGRAGGGNEPPRAQQGRSIDVEETVDFTTAAIGGSRSFKIDGQSFEVKIPAGTVDGAKLAVRGKGGAGSNGGAAGDVVITVRVAPHPWIRREGDDLVVAVPLSIAEATLGTTVRVPLLEGSVTIKVPPGVRSGQKLRVKGKGIQRAKGEPGDFYAQLQIEAPKQLDERQRQLLEELAPTLPSPRTGAAWKE